MANRNYPASRVFGFNLMPVRLNVSIPIGATGAVGTISGKGIQSVTRLATGTYQIQLQDNYYSFLSMSAMVQSPVSGSNVTAGSFSTGTVYQITALGSTTQAQWVTAGVPAGITAQVGTVFKAAAAGAGTGTAKVLASSGIASIEQIGSEQLMLSNQPFVQGSGGGYITLRCYGPTSSSDTTLIATDPASGSTLNVAIWLNNSSIQ